MRARSGWKVKTWPRCLIVSARHTGQADGLHFPGLQPLAGAERGRKCRTATSGFRNWFEGSAEAVDRGSGTVGIAQWAKHEPAEISGGQRQRVTIARSLVNNPALIWADEPTGALDSSTANEIMGLLRELNEREGLTCVIVTHDPGIGDRCDRVVRMRDGSIVSQNARQAYVTAESH